MGKKNKNQKYSLSKYEHKTALTRGMVNSAVFGEFSIWMLNAAAVALIMAPLLFVLDTPSFWLLELVPLTMAIFAPAKVYQRGLNKFAHYLGADMPKSFTLLDGGKAFLGLPINKEVQCNQMKRKYLQKKGSKKEFIGIQKISIKNIDGKLIIDKKFHEDPAFKWDRTLSLATSTDLLPITTMKTISLSS